MAENDPQYRCITDTRFALEQYYRHDPQVYVGADLMMYFEEGDPTKSVAPDVLVALGAAAGIRRTFLIWAEGKAPDLIFEFASEGTWRADVGWKLGLYQGLGVREYFIFDPLDQYIKPALQGYRLEGSRYQPLPTLGTERGLRGLRSEVLGLELWMQPDGGQGMPYALRLYDPGAAAWLPTPVEEAEARRRAERRVVDLERELAQLRAQLAANQR